MHVHVLANVTDHMSSSKETGTVTTQSSSPGTPVGEPSKDVLNPPMEKQQDTLMAADSIGWDGELSSPLHSDNVCDKVLSSQDISVVESLMPTKAMSVTPHQTSDHGIDSSGVRSVGGCKIPAGLTTPTNNRAGNYCNRSSFFANDSEVGSVFVDGK